MESTEEIKEEKIEFEFKTTAQYYNALRYSAKFVINKIGAADVAVVLGSGLGGLVNTLSDPVSLEYTEIPFMPMTSVVGHGKTLYNGKIGEKRVLLWSGRVHMYEGYSSHQLTFITYLSAFIGCKYIILTNSSGGGLEGMKCGSLMVSKDHLAFASKCAIPATYNDPRFGVRNLHSSDSHSVYLRDLAKKIAKDNDVELFEGNYCWTTGPSYETPLEATVLRKFGGGCFGMSTVPEIIAAGQIGLECVVLTMITNLAAGLQKALSHVEVHDEAMKAGPKLAALVSEIVKSIDSERETNLKLHDELSSLNQLSSYLMKNPKPTLCTKESIKEALDMLNVMNLGHSKAKEVYWFMSTGAHQDIIKNADLTEIRELPFEELHNMPTKTSAAKTSKLVFATTSLGNRVIIVMNSFIEGLLPVESLFLVHLLHSYGVTMIKFIIEAASTNKNENLKEGCFVVASDYVNRSHFSPCDPDMDYFYPYKSIKKHIELQFKKTLCDKLGDEASNFENITFILQDGPCYPTNANISMYKQTNQDLYTITNTSPIDIANTLGILQSTFVVVRNKDFETYELHKGMEIAQILFEDFSNEKISENFGYSYNPLELSQNTQLFKQQNSLLNYDNIDHITLEIPLHSNVEDLDKTVSQIKEFMGLTKPSYLGVNMHHITFNSASNHFKIKRVVKFVSSIQLNQSLPELIYCTFNDKEDVELLIMKGMIMHHETLDPTARSIPTRILHKLGVSTFYLIGNVFGADEEMNVGDLFIPVDHCNLSTLNTTSGPNIDSWGKRFYDVSKCYHDHLIEDFEAKAASHKDVKVFKAQLLYVNNSKSYAGLGEQQFCKGMGVTNKYNCTAVSFQGHAEIMTMRHMDFDSNIHALYIGVVFDRCVNESEGTHIDTFNSTDYSKGVDNALKILKETL